jgi:hypothetical protein
VGTTVKDNNRANVVVAVRILLMVENERGRVKERRSAGGRKFQKVGARRSAGRHARRGPLLSACRATDLVASFFVRFKFGTHLSFPSSSSKQKREGDGDGSGGNNAGQSCLTNCVGRYSTMRMTQHLRFVFFVIVMMALVAFVVNAEKDSDYYLAGFTNPNTLSNEMYWKDSVNVMQDLDQFEALYITYHHWCVWRCELVA